MTSEGITEHALSRGLGYGLIFGLGLAFSVIMLAVIYLQAKFTHLDPRDHREFSTASQSVKAGLIGCGIVSAWTWSATLLQSSAVAFRYGISGPYWYAAGATVQVLLFAQNAAKLKMHAPGAKTFLQVIYVRWGKTSHLILMGFALATNIVSSMLITGASATIKDLTGIPTEVGCFLIPISVVIYVVIGGMRASLLGDFVHTTILYIIIFVFMFSVYATSDRIGSPKKMYDMLVQAASSSPVQGNAQGSYVTMRSVDGLVFGVINLVGNFATVYNDQAYWQRAIASCPETAVTGFLIGGLSWFPIPFGFATTLGLAAVALGAQVSSAEVSAGLIAPKAASILLGQAGAACVLVILFLAVTSAASAELVAVSSIAAYDVYKTYLKPNATEKQIMRISHSSVVLYGLVMAVLGIMFDRIGITMGWLYLFMGTILGGSVTPIAMGIMSRSANRVGCTSASLIGLVFGIVAWLITAAKLNDGVINVTTTGQNYPMLAGNLSSIGASTLLSFLTSYLWPENYDFEVTRAIDRQERCEPGTSKGSNDVSSVDMYQDVKKSDSVTSVKQTGDIDIPALRKSYRIAVGASLTLFLVLIILVPLPLFFTSHIYSQAGFTVWVILGFLWLFGGAIAVVLGPLWESRQFLKDLFKKILGLSEA